MAKSKGKKLREKPEVHTYQDFKRFLADQIAYLKDHAPAGNKITLQALARQSGFQSHNLLGRIMKGERSLCSSNIANVAQALQLNAEEASFFSDLVHLNQAKSSEERSFYSQRLVNSRKFQKAFPLKKAELRYLSDWYLPAVRELVELPDFREDPRWIARRLKPGITPAQAKRALKVLEELEFIKRDQQGRFRQTSASIDTGDLVISPLIPAYHKAMIKMGLESVDRYGRELRNLQAVTLSLPKEKHEQLWDLISRFRQEVVSLAQSEDPADGVYQVNFQLFPLALPANEEDME